MFRLSFLAVRGDRLRYRTAEPCIMFHESTNHASTHRIGISCVSVTHLREEDAVQRLIGPEEINMTVVTAPLIIRGLRLDWPPRSKKRT